VRYLKDETYMAMAEAVAKESRAERLQVGSIIVVNQQTSVHGFNGTPPGEDNVCEDETGRTKPNVVHAEVHTILAAKQLGVDVVGSTLFCTHAPCINCATAIVDAGISRVVYRNSYRDQGGIDLLVSANIEVTELK
jgi:dCMP deaminase